VKAARSFLWKRSEITLLPMKSLSEGGLLRGSYNDAWEDLGGIVIQVKLRRADPIAKFNEMLKKKIIIRRDLSIFPVKKRNGLERRMSQKLPPDGN